MAAEKDFENQIKKWFHSIGIYPAGMPEDRMTVPPIGWYTKIWGGGYQKAGVPDLICNIDGLFLAIEIKAENGRPSELQVLNTDRIRDSGGQAVILYPSGFNDFKADLYFFKEHLVLSRSLLRKEYK